MHPYKLSVNHIDSDFGFGSGAESQWSTRIESDEALVVFLNRVAIATSTNSIVEHPEIEIPAGCRRAIVTAVDGHLFYTELDANKQHLKVVADEVVHLLKGLPFEPMAEVESEEEAEHERHYAHRNSNGGIRIIGWSLLLAILAACSFVLWKEIRYRPSLVEQPKFIEVSEGRSEALKELAGIYIHEYREGGMLFEIQGDGRLDFYELWESRTSKGFVRLPLESHELKVGLHQGEEAYLAGELHLIRPTAEGGLELHGLRFSRYDGRTAELGPVRKAP